MSRKAGTKNRVYTGDFKKEVVEDMRNNNLSFSETSKKYSIKDTTIANWERIYLTEGAAGLNVERRGKNSTGRPLKLSKELEDDLIKENQYLRMKLDFLTRLQELIDADQKKRK